MSDQSEKVEKLENPKKSVNKQDTLSEDKKMK
jgi:hypothetical protein